MSATATATVTADEPTFFEEEAREIATAITTLGRLLPPGMVVTVAYAAGLPAVCSVIYPDGSIATKEFQGGAIH